MYKAQHNCREGMMKSQVKFIGAPLLALLVVVGAVDSVKAQPVWLSPTPDPGISV